MTLRVTNPARQSLASSRKRVWRGGGRPPRRSGDSESRCRAIEPRNLRSWEPPSLTQAGAAPRRRHGLAHLGPTGVQEQGAGTRGSLGNLRDPATSVVAAGRRPGLPTPGRSPAPVPGRWGRTGDQTTVSPTEGDEGRRDGRPGVGASHSSDEAGEPSRGTPRSQGDAVSTNRWRETWRVHRNPWTCPRNNNG